MLLTFTSRTRHSRTALDSYKKCIVAPESSNAFVDD